MHKTILSLSLLAIPLYLASPHENGAAEQDADWLPFRHSSLCGRCHDNSDKATALRDEKGSGIAPNDLWEATMMANSARDPFWRAAVAREVEFTPAAKSVIEAKCMRCHSPMADPVHGNRGHEFRMSMLTEVSNHATDALDGVSCTVCHAISDEGLGTEANYDGMFKLNRERKLYARHEKPRGMPMRSVTGLTPTASDHLQESKACASCHTLATHALTPEGKPTGSIHQEQSPYREWRNSVFSTEVAQPGPEAASCQDCHMPTTSSSGKAIKTRIAHSPMGSDWNVPERSPYSKHLVVGGNSLIPAMLRDNPELRAQASREAFDATIAAVKDQLRHRTAKLEIDAASFVDSRLRFRVGIENLVGHKFPSAYPSRRAWLRIRVLDRAGKVWFESGNWNAEGFLVDSEGKVLPSEQAGGPLQQHHTRITSADQVQIYEAIMKDDANKPTWVLMRAAGYAKDSRILPKGWSPDHPEAQKTAPVGTEDDKDFLGGTDRLEIDILLDQAQGPFKVQVDLFYQSQGSRYLSEFLTAKNAEVRRYEALWKKTDRRPSLVASQEIEIR